MDTWFPGGTTLTALDFCVLGVLIAGMLAVAYRFGQGVEDAADFFLARRRIPGWAACLSFVSAEINALTLFGLPAVAYSQDWRYFQFFLGSALARTALAWLFVPAFHRPDFTTPYEYLGRRFGPATHRVGAALFWLSRLLGSGVRLMAAAVAMAALMGCHWMPVIVLFTMVGIACLGFGGLRAAVWTGVYQTAVIAASGFLSLVFLVRHIRGGLPAVWVLAQSSGHLRLWGGPGIGSAAVLSGFVLSLAAFGTDHEYMQRFMAVEDPKESRRAMAWTIFASFAVLFMYLAVGTGIHVYYTQHPELAMLLEPDKIYPHYVVQVLPMILRGLVLSALFMAAVDSPLVSMAASFVTDVYRPLVRSDADDRHYLLVARASVVLFGLALAAAAYGFGARDDLQWAGFKLGGVLLGPLLGVFLLGLLTDIRADISLAAAMVGMILAILALAAMMERRGASLDLHWLVLLGAIGTFGLCRGLSRFPFLASRGET